VAKLDVTQGLDEDAEATPAALEAVAQPEKSLEVRVRDGGCGGETLCHSRFE